MNRNSGNIIFYVLLAVGLLAALSYTVAKSSRGTGGVSKERSALSATEVLQFANILANAVGQLRLRGCLDTEISFDNVVDAEKYNNADAPSDGSCDVFGITGGGLTYNQGLTYFITGDYAVDDIGSDAPDLLVDVTVERAVCTQINGSLDIAGDLPIDSLSGGDAFDGSYNALGGVSGRIEHADLAGRMAGCREDGDSFKYYKVLLSR